MKNYTIIALPESKICSAVEKLRLDTTGQVLVDSLPPHVTFKRRFELNGDFSEINLVNYFKKLRFKKFKVNFIGKERMGNVLALVGVSDEMKYAHTLLVNNWSKRITTKHPEWEGGNYKIHMTLLRGQVNNVVLSEIKVVNFNALVLYEIDSSPERLFANEIARIELD